MYACDNTVITQMYSTAGKPVHPWVVRGEMQFTSCELCILVLALRACSVATDELCYTEGGIDSYYSMQCMGVLEL